MCSLQCILRHIIISIVTNLWNIIVVVIIGPLRIFRVVLINFVFIHGWIGLWVPKIIIPALIPGVVIQVVFFCDIWVRFILVIIFKMWTTLIRHPLIGIPDSCILCFLVSAGINSITNGVISIEPLVSSIAGMVLEHQLRGASTGGNIILDLRFRLNLAASTGILRLILSVSCSCSRLVLLLRIWTRVLLTVMGCYWPAVNWIFKTQGPTILSRQTQMKPRSFLGMSVAAGL